MMQPLPGCSSFLDQFCLCTGAYQDQVEIFDLIPDQITGFN